MTKRRRERDRPKAGPDSVYNPNKRVLLSYASDEEDTDDDIGQTLGTGNTAAVDAVSADYAIPPYPQEEEEYIPEPLGEPVNEDAPTSVPDESSEISTNEQSNNQRSHYKRSTTKNAITGQWPAIGSLAYQWDDEGEGEGVESYDSAEEEAMAYLKAVRNERMALPEVVRAQHNDMNEEIYKTGNGDARGYVKDGAYVGCPDIGPVMPRSAHSQISPFEAYTTSLKNRFLDQREQMHSNASAEALGKLDDKHPTTFDIRNNKLYAQWTRTLKSTPPLPAQIRTLDADAVNQLLQLIQRIFLFRGEPIHESTSIWIWSLLARLDDVGTMNNEEVYALREFGKRAVLIQLSLFDPAAALLLENVNQEENVVSGAAGTEGETNMPDGGTAHSVGKPPELPDTTSSSAQNTLITLDAVITIIGEVFGQRDLLDFRREWPGSTEAQAEADRA
ncbi:hypothetical protein LTR78_009411 [Recurvomyces mirabilis]|uniref:Uncharacterized protein n=1 Tax=Recurvomyces mirabilis TaxID=574656 RepID=A0AAE0WGJ6_9PEZI|nr:hypothetical protein LTR78_009411 [Recurvomyces mirabilis]KAK5154301.1 hypothetical protein LTS14_006986 [Recurvomyces mirabilis]